MSLNERKIQILQAIINDYIETAEPVGSRTIAKKYNLGKWASSYSPMLLPAEFHQTWATVYM